MNYFGSYKALFANARSAMVSAIEIYNKPRVTYRDEVFVILLVNGWELLLKALISKARKSIYYKKKRGEPYKTLSWPHALLAAKETDDWPADIPWQALQANLRQLTVYRDNAVHFYNAEGFGSIIYGLAHTAIRNFNDLCRAAFGKDLTNEMTWALLPLGAAPPFDPIQYLRGARTGNKSSLTAVDEFLGFVQDQIKELTDAGVDVDRFLTVFSVKLESVKKIEKADVVVGIDAEAAGAGEPVYIERRVDPLKSHPLRQKNVLAEITHVDGRRFTSYDFQAIVFAKGWRANPAYCWHDPDTGTTRWSREIVPLLRRLKAKEVGEARATYAARAHA
jgi:EC042_2821-lke REase/Protein of unknown function (DUF3644)